MAVRKPAKVASALKSPPVQPSAPKERRPALKKTKNPSETSIERLEASLAELSGDRDRLASELASALKQIAALEAARLDAINRIDWAIDSLQSAIQK